MPRPQRPDEYYDAIKQKFAEERDLRLAYRPEGTQQFTSEFSGELAKYATDPYGGRDQLRANRSTTPSKCCSSVAASRRC